MIDRLSRGKSRKRRQGPLIDSGLGASDDLVVECLMEESSAAVELFVASDSLPTAADTDGTNMDLGRWLVDCRDAASEGVPGEGAETKSLYELSDTRGTFQGKRRSVMQAKIIAIDQTSVG